MSDTLIDILGYAAAAMTTTAFVPQVVKTWRSRHARDISLGMYVLFCLGISCWLAYGLVAGAGPVIAANAATLVLALCVLGMKLMFK